MTDNDATMRGDDHVHAWENALGATCVECHIDMIEYARRAEGRIATLEAEIAAMRAIVEAVAHGVSYHATVVDVWVLRFANPTLSYVQEIREQARAFVATHPAAGQRVKCERCGAMVAQSALYLLSVDGVALRVCSPCRQASLLVEERREREAKS